MAISNTVAAVDAIAATRGLSAGTTATAGVPLSVWVPVIAAGVAAVIAAVAAVWGASLQRKSGKEAAAAALKSAEAAKTSSDASTQSARAAKDSVELNREVAADTAKRADAAALAERYQDAAAQLGHDKAAVRLAGVYAMCRLADDWPDERQTCIDVLCAYLRLPWQASADSKITREDAQVRQTIVSVVNQHVGEHARVSWAENHFDFTRAELRDFVLNGCTFTGRVTFAGAEFVGKCALDDIAFRGGATFAASVVHDRLRLDDIRAAGGQQVTFAGAQIDPDAELEIIANTKDPNDPRRYLDFTSLAVMGKLTIRHTTSVFKLQPPLDLSYMKLDSGCVEVISTLLLTKDPRPRYPYKIKARDWEISPGSQILIPEEFVDDDRVQWSRKRSLPAIPDDVKITFKVPPPTDF